VKMAVEIPVKNGKATRRLSVADYDDGSGSGSDVSSSPSTKSLITGHGSELFKSVLEDYIFHDSRVSKFEFERYKSKLQNKNKNCEEHARSTRCESCQAVMAFCKCNLYGGGGGRRFGHRVHWADEVWNKPLTTSLTDTHSPPDSDNDDVYSHNETEEKIVHIGPTFRHAMPKPILKHRATCIVIVSE